jgi:hypothetical protein
LQASLLEGRRVSGRVRQEQIAALGPIKLPLTGRAPHRGRRGYTWSTGMGFEPVGLSNLVEEIRHARAGIEAGDAKMSSRIASSNPSTLCSSESVVQAGRHSSPTTRSPSALEFKKSAPSCAPPK